jgi:hypothetical protein
VLGLFCEAQTARFNQRRSAQAATLHQSAIMTATDAATLPFSVLQMELGIT